MSARESVTPETLSVRVTDEEIAVAYQDGHIVRFQTPPEPTTPPVRTQPQRRVQVLIVNEEETDGQLIYINELNTEAEILQETGVGRAFVDTEEPIEVLPGVVAYQDGYAVVVDLEPKTTTGRVFLFEEDQFAEQAYELLQ